MRSILKDLAQLPMNRGLYIEEALFDDEKFVPYPVLARSAWAAAARFSAAGVRAGDGVIFPFETTCEALVSFLGLVAMGAVPHSIKPAYVSGGKRAYKAFLTEIARRHAPKFAMRSCGWTPAGTRILDGVDVDPGADAAPPADVDQPLAFVQLSSGSTAFPKGIPISVDALQNNLQWIIDHDGRQPDAQGYSWLPLYHDMGLVGGLLTNLLCGNDITLRRPEHFLLSPLKWLQELSRRRAYVTPIPSFALGFALERLPQSDLEGVDLSALEVIYLGAEQISPSMLDAFVERLAPYGLRREAFNPCYGMAEAVLMVTGTPRGRGARVVAGENGRPVVSVGRPFASFEVRIVDEHGRPCRDSQLGEIELRGGSLSGRYMDPHARFYSDEGYYETGDLGFVQDGELFIAGRFGERLKLNGQSYFAPDLEQAAESVPFVRAGRTAAFEANDGGEIRIAIEVRGTVPLQQRDESAEQIVRAIYERCGLVLERNVVLFVQNGTITKTSSGKIRRRALLERHRRWGLPQASIHSQRRDAVRHRIRRLPMEARTLVASLRQRTTAAFTPASRPNRS